MSGTSIGILPTPRSVQRAVEEGAKAMAGAGSAIPEQLIHLTRALPVFLVGPTWEMPAADAVPDAWRFLAITSDQPLWIEIVNGSIAGVLRGKPVAALLDACAAAAAYGASGDASIIIAPTIVAEAVRVKGGDDLFWPLSVASARAPLTRREIVSEWSTAARSLRPGNGAEPVQQEGD